MTQILTHRQEIGRLARIAGPLAAAYLAEYAMFITTKLVVGDLGYLALGAAGVAGSMAFEILVIFFGLLSVIGVLAAQAEGAGLKADAGHAARQGLIVAGLIGLPLTIVIANLDMLLAATGQDPDVVALAGPYLSALSFFVLPALWFTALRDFVAALSRTTSVMAITVSAVAVNWALTEGLVHGRWGLPEMGIAGAGASTAIVHWLMLAALAITIFRTPSLRGYGLFRSRLRVDPKVMVEFFRLGFPIAGLVAVEAGLFMAVGLLSGVIGAETLAAHQVLMAWIGIPFMIAMALAEGSMVRVAYNIGAGSPVGARHAGLVAMAVGGAILSALVAAPLLLAEDFTRIFLAADQDGFDEVAAVVVQLMAIAAAFQVFDGVQAIASRSLRGLKDALAPFLIGAFGYWVVGIGLGWVLAFPLDWRGPGLWTGLAVGLFVAAILLTLRFLTKTRALIAAARQSGP